MSSPTQFIFDFNNLAIINMHIPDIKITEAEPNWDLWHYTLFLRIHDFVMHTLVQRKIGNAEVYIARDMRTPSWRAQLYAPYKGNRVKDLKIDWDQVAIQMDVFNDKVRAHLPWRTVMVQDAEADDIIAIMAKEGEAKNKKTVIYSTDADYMQLCSELTSVYRPHIKDFVGFPGTVKIAGKELHCETKEDFLLLSVLTGQGRKDNVFNIKTDTNWVPTPEHKRMSPFGVVAAQKVINAPGGMQKALTEMGCYENYKRNALLIDFNQIPEHIHTKIMNEVSCVNRVPYQYDIEGFLLDTVYPTDESIVTDYPELYEEIFKMEENTVEPQTETTPEAPKALTTTIYSVYTKDGEYATLVATFANKEHADGYIKGKEGTFEIEEQDLYLASYEEVQKDKKQALIASAMSKLTDEEKAALGLS